jgi:hypothetical protein
MQLRKTTSKIRLRNSELNQCFEMANIPVCTVLVDNFLMKEILLHKVI